MSDGYALAEVDFDISGSGAGSAGISNYGIWPMRHVPRLIGRVEQRELCAKSERRGFGIVGSAGDDILLDLHRPETAREIRR